MGTSTLPITSVHVRGNRFDLLSRMAGDLAHEIRNPLHAVVINLELARRRVVAGAGDAVLDRLDLVETEIGRVHQLVDGILRLLRDLPGQTAVAVPAALERLRPLIDARARLSGVAVSWELPPMDGALCAAAIAPGAFDQVIMNVAANAIEAVRPHPGRVEIRAGQSGKEVVVEVRDTGPGISPEAAANFGVLGYSTRPGHSGFGVAVSRHLVEAAGGRLEVSGAGPEEWGATVRVVLPAAATA